VHRFSSLSYQEEFLLDLLIDARITTLGIEYEFGTISSVDTFRDRVPLHTYDDIQHLIERSLAGISQLLTPYPIIWYAKSGGTTSSSCKYLPVTTKALEDNHKRAAKDFVSHYIHHFPDSNLLAGKGLILAGGFDTNPITGTKNVGYISGILQHEMPWWSSYFKAVDDEIIAEEDREKKMHLFIERFQHERISSLSGVGPWLVLLAQHVYELTEKPISQLRPELELLMSGGVPIDFYLHQYQQQFGEQIHVYNMYNASEGFYAFQDDPTSHEMLLCPHHGIFYEFIPMQDWAGTDSPTVTLDQVETGITYALVITTAAGLWRYITGDTIMFSQLRPWKIQVTGRTKYYLNVL
jgi:hypothetical protein